MNEPLPTLDAIIADVKACIREVATDRHPRRSLERLMNLPELEVVALEAGIDFDALVQDVIHGR